MTTRLLGFLKHSLVQNLLALYGAQAANYLLPLLVLPYLARVLGPGEWGLLAFTQSLGQYLALGVEYGFALSATRQVARLHDRPEERARLLVSVLGAKALLSLLVLGLFLLLLPQMPLLQNRPHLAWAGLFYGLATGFSMLWYFQGLERMGLVVTLDVASRGLSTLGVFLLVRGPEDSWKALALQGLASLVSSGLALLLASREVPLGLPTWREVLEALRLGWSMFLFRGAVSLYTLGNVFLLGLFAPPQVVGYYAGAERIAKAILGLLSPYNQALYPRISHLLAHSPGQALTLVQLSLRLMGVGGSLLGAFVFATAPLLVHLLLGPGYEPAVPALRLLALLLPLIALSNVLGVLWMLPLGLDRPFNAIILAAGLLNLFLALLLAPPFGHMGMASAVVLAEAFVTGAMALYLLRRDLSSIRKKGTTGRRK